MSGAYRTRCCMLSCAPFTTNLYNCCSVCRLIASTHYYSSRDRRAIQVSKVHLFSKQVSKVHFLFFGLVLLLFSNVRSLYEIIKETEKKISQHVLTQTKNNDRKVPPVGTEAQNKPSADAYNRKQLLLPISMTMGAAATPS